MDEEQIINYIKLQSKLTEAFQKCYPTANDFKYLSGFPKKGVINLDLDQWTFRKHGIGICFTRENNTYPSVVDIHNHFGQPLYVDSWRLVLFFEAHSHFYPPTEAEI